MTPAEELINAHLWGWDGVVVMKDAAITWDISGGPMKPSLLRKNQFENPDPVETRLRILMSQAHS